MIPEGEAALGAEIEPRLPEAAGGAEHGTGQWPRWGSIRGGGRGGPYPCTYFTPLPPPKKNTQKVLLPFPSLRFSYSQRGGHGCPCSPLAGSSGVKPGPPLSRYFGQGQGRGKLSPTRNTKNLTLSHYQRPKEGQQPALNCVPLPVFSASQPCTMEFFGHDKET